MLITSIGRIKKYDDADMYVFNSRWQCCYSFSALTNVLEIRLMMMIMEMPILIKSNVAMIIIKKTYIENHTKCTESQY